MKYILCVHTYEEEGSTGVGSGESRGWWNVRREEIG